jgi:hypothetical protein
MACLKSVRLAVAADSPGGSRVSGAVDNPKHWYDRGAEMRVLAETMKDAEAQGNNA